MRSFLLKGINFKEGGERVDTDSSCLLTFEIYKCDINPVVFVFKKDGTMESKSPSFADLQKIYSLNPLFLISPSDDDLLEEGDEAKEVVKKAEDGHLLHFFSMTFYT